MKTTFALFAALALFSSAAFASGDVPARNCEIFIDRAMATHGSHAMRALTFWVKISRERLDGDVVRVVAWNRDNGEEKPVEMKPFNGGSRASDYWEMGYGLFVGGDYSVRHTYEAAFYVETTQGTRYWANPADGGNFVLDQNMVENLDRVTGSYKYEANPRYAASTVDQFPYLNPQGCR